MVASGEGRMNFGTWKASTRTCHSTITARCTIRMIAKVLAERIPSLNTPYSRLKPANWLTIRLLLVALVNGAAHGDKRVISAADRERGERHEGFQGCGVGAGIDRA